MEEGCSLPASPWVSLPGSGPGPLGQLVLTFPDCPRPRLALTPDPVHVAEASKGLAHQGLSLSLGSGPRRDGVHRRGGSDTPVPGLRHSWVLPRAACLGGWLRPEPSLLSPLLQPHLLPALHSGRFSEGQLPSSSLGKHRECCRVLRSSFPKPQEWRDRVRSSSCLGNSVLGEAARGESQRLFPIWDLLDKSLNALSFPLFEMG